MKHYAAGAGQTGRRHSARSPQGAGEPVRKGGIVAKKAMGMEKVCGLVVFCLGLAIIWQGRGLSFGTLSAPGPGFFPFLLAGVLIVLSVPVFFMGQAKEGEDRFFTATGLRRVGSVFLALIAYYVLLERLGFLPVSFLLMAFLFAFIAKYVWHKALVCAFLSTGLAYLLFEILLKSNLPKGALGF
jgi:putative tricarboxylic transport membrane protein